MSQYESRAVAYLSSEQKEFADAVKKYLESEAKDGESVVIEPEENVVCLQVNTKLLNRLSGKDQQGIQL